MKSKVTNILFNFILITFLILNSFNIFQPISGNICKCIPVYLSFGILLSLIGIILIFLLFCFGTKNQILDLLKDYKKKNKYYNVIVSAIIIIMFIINGFVGNLALYLILKCLLAILTIEIDVIKEKIESEI